jgi:ribosome-binding ATPase YchF (GTP1/OBG family)
VLFLRLKEGLEAERPIRELELSPDEQRRLRNYSLLSEKPLLLAVNLGESQVREAAAFLERSGLAGLANRPRVQLCPISAPIEAEMARLDPADARAFLDDLGLAEPGLDRVLRATYALLGHVSFLTVGEDECRAWTIRSGTRAQEAAGVVHSDIERGFIRAEVVSFDDLVRAGSMVAAREKGWLHLEGKDYLVQDGDIVHFRFNV